MIKLLSECEATYHRQQIETLLKYCRESSSKVHFSDDYYEEKVDSLLNYLKEQRAYYFAVFENESIVGFMWACVIEKNSQKVFHILYFAVLPDYQSRGYGGKLMREAEKQARLSECNQIELNVNIRNVNVINFYKKHLFYEDHIVLKRDI